MRRCCWLWVWQWHLWDTGKWESKGGWDGGGRVRPASRNPWSWLGILMFLSGSILFTLTRGRHPHWGNCIWSQGSATSTPPYFPTRPTWVEIHRPSPYGLCYLVPKWLAGIEPSRNKSSTGYQKTNNVRHCFLITDPPSTPGSSEGRRVKEVFSSLVS